MHIMNLNLLWLMWILFLLLFLIIPIAYGWGYRRWGPPYPRYVQRRRGLQTAGAAGGGGVATSPSHQAWGWRGDFVWIAMLMAIFWAGLALWWR
jgi:hypothetical protein